MPKRPRAAEEGLQRGGRSPGLPGVVEPEEWAAGTGVAPDSRPQLLPGPPPLRAGEDVPRSVKVREAGAAASRQSCEELREEVWATPGEPLVPASPDRLPSGLSHPALLINPPRTTPSQCPGRCRCLRDSETSEH